MAKEILKDEVLTEEQLDEVAGGTRGQLSCDTKFLHALGVMDFEHEAGYCGNHMSEVRGEINNYLERNDKLKGFKVAAVSSSGDNTYKINGKKVSRSIFYSDICNALGKSKFDWKAYI